MTDRQTVQTDMTSTRLGLKRLKCRSYTQVEPRGRRGVGCRVCFRLSFFAKKFKIDRSDRIVAAPALFPVQPVQERECSVSESVGRSVLFPSHLRA